VTFLLDLNVLIALIDPTHISHDTAHDWFSAEALDGWATCPLVENGVIRIVAHPRYPNARFSWRGGERIAGLQNAARACLLAG
jgi:predicted nucleic acid-binding protein